MYASKNATREFALKTVAAAERAMERHVCCKSQFKFKCFSCGEMINRGDQITKCTAPCWDGMRLRFRGADARNGLTMEETAFYLAETGTRTWVHVGCNPCYWDRAAHVFQVPGLSSEGWTLCEEEDSNEYSPPALRSAYTDWGAKISYEFEEWRQLTNHYDMEEFLEKHGYPQEKWMKERIKHNVTRFQAIWRGYLYKRAYPIALQQKKATEAINYRVQASVAADNLRKPRNPHNHCARIKANMERLKRLNVGDHIEMLFNEKKLSEAIYSGEIYEIQYRGGWIKIKVKFHYDGEIRKYSEERFRYLKKQCEEFKAKMGIPGVKISGKVTTHGRLYPTL